MKSTFKVLFYLKKGSEKKNGEVMIMARITIDGKLCQFSTKQSIQPDNWSIAAGKAKGRDAGRINALLDDIRSSLNTIYHEMQRRDNYVTAEKVKNEFLGHSESHETILSLFQKHNDDVKQLVGISKTIATYRKYEVTRRHLAEFIQSKYNVSDISIKDSRSYYIYSSVPDKLRDTWAWDKKIFIKGDKAAPHVFIDGVNIKMSPSSLGPAIELNKKASAYI